VEFVSESEAFGVLEQFGIIPTPDPSDADFMPLTMQDQDDAVHVHVTNGESAATPRDGARVVEVEPGRLPKAVEHLIHQLHLSEVLLVPVTKWRAVFDAVAFSMASNEEWSEVDATATVELNRRDPMLFEPADYHTLIDLITALISDGEERSQGLVVVSPAAPVLLEIIPDGAVRMSFGTPALADEVDDVFA